MVSDTPAHSTLTMKGTDSGADTPAHSTLTMKGTAAIYAVHPLASPCGIYMKMTCDIIFTDSVNVQQKQNPGCVAQTGTSFG